MPLVDVPVFTYLEGRIPIYRHEHVAVIRPGRAEPVCLAPFLAEGLRLGDRCCYLAPQALHAAMLERLGALEVDANRHLRDGSLRLQAGTADYRQLRESAEQFFLESERVKESSVRWLEEGIWPEPAGLPMPQFFEFHALLNYQVKMYSSVALCQYNIEQVEAHHLLCAIAVHRHLLVGDTLVRDNPFYIPAEKFVPLSPEERERDLLRVFREVGFDVEKLLVALKGYGQIQRPRSQNS